MAPIRGRDEGLFELNCALVREAFGRRVIGEDFAVPGVDRGGGLSQIGPVHVVKRFPLGVDASQFTVEVFVGPALPSVVRLGKVDLAVERVGDPGMVGEFTTVIERDGVDRVLERRHHRGNRVGDGGLRAASDGARDQKPGLPFHERDDRAAMTCPNDGVAFPVAKGLAGLDGGRTLVDINACGNEMGTGMRGSRSGPLAKLAQEQAYPVIVAGLDFAAEQFIDPRGGQFQRGACQILRV